MQILSDGKNDPKTGLPVFDLTKPVLSISAATLRKRELKHQIPERPKPEPKYQPGDIVEVPEQYMGEQTKSLIVAGCIVGMIICAAEWGGENKRSLPGESVWYYTLRNYGKVPGPPIGEPIPEYLILGKVE